MTIESMANGGTSNGDVEASRSLNDRILSAFERYVGTGWGIDTVPRSLPAPRTEVVVADVRLDPSSDAVEALYQRTIGAGHRVIALIGIERGDGVSALATALAQRSSLAPNRTLLIDASGKIDDAEDTPPPNHEAFKRHELRPEPEHYRHRSTEFLREQWEESCTHHRALIIDCAPALGTRQDAIPGALVARSADAVVLICRGGASTRDAIASAKSALGAARIVGIVVNGRDQPTVGAEIAREAMRLSSTFPSLAQTIAERAKKWSILDVPG